MKGRNAMIKKILQAMENRRKWNRTKRFLQARTTSRLIVSLISTGALKCPEIRGRARA